MVSLGVEAENRRDKGRFPAGRWRNFHCTGLEPTLGLSRSAFGARHSTDC